MKKIIYLIFFVLFSGCASLYCPYNVNTINDEFDGYVINRMEDNVLLNKDVWSSDFLYLNLQKFTKGNKSSYTVIVNYQASDWLFIEGNESLVFLVDGERMGFSGDGSIGHRNVSEIGIKEQAWYNITPEQIYKIGNAKSVEVKVLGKNFYIERTFHEHSLRNFRKFYCEYIDDRDDSFKKCDEINSRVFDKK